MRESSARVSKSETEEAEREPTGARRQPKGSPNEPNGCNMSKSCSKIKPSSVRALFIYVEFFRQKGKNVHGTLVGLTQGKGASAENAFLFFGKINKT